MIAPDTYTWSPSQIVTFTECARKWAFKSIAKVKTPQAASAALGTDTHKQLETYLGGGQLDYTRDSGYIAATGLQYLPDPSTPGLLLEGHFKFQSPDTGFHYQGYRDFYVPASSRPEGRPLIGDHKTTANLRYAKTEADLHKDPQAIIYARNENTDGDTDLRWVYYQTKGTRKAECVDVTLPRRHVLSEFANLELTAQQMRGIVDESRTAQGELEEFVKTLPPNPSACEMYGGCPYRHLCQLGPEDRLSSMFGKELKIMEDQMTQGVSSLIARIQAQTAQAAPAIPAPTPVPAVVDHGPAKGQDTFSSDFVNPPVLPPVLDPAQAAVHTAPTTPPPPPPAQEPAKRTRRTKAEMEAARGVPVQNVANVTHTYTSPADLVLPVGRVEEASTFPHPRVLEGKDGYILYVDCLPNTPVADLTQALNLAKTAVCEKTGKPDYRLVDYGQGAGLLAIAVEDLIDGGHVRGDVFISSQLQETHAVLEVLTRRASRVVRAVR